MGPSPLPKVPLGTAEEKQTYVMFPAIEGTQWGVRAWGVLEWWSAGKPYVIKPNVQVIHGFFHLALQLISKKLNEVGRGRAGGWRHDYAPQLLYVLLCTRIRFEVLYTTRGTCGNTKDLRSYIPPSLEGDAEAISARLKDSTLG